MTGQARLLSSYPNSRNRKFVVCLSYMESKLLTYTEESIYLVSQICSITLTGLYDSGMDVDPTLCLIVFV
jgi:hypothetical protein